MDNETRQAIVDEVRKYMLPPSKPPKKKLDIFEILALVVAVICCCILVLSIAAWIMGIDFPHDTANYSKWLLGAVCVGGGICSTIKDCYGKGE